MGNLAVRVTKDASRHIRGGHPWVYDESIMSLSPDGVSGDLAVIFDDHRKFMAIGLYDPDSPIRIKVLHHGSPVTIDENFWRERVAAAMARRRSLVGSTATTGYRVIHGENDQLPGFVLDRYGDVLVIKLYSRAWFRHLDAMVAAITEHLEPTSIVLRLARNVSGGAVVDGTALFGPRPDAPVAYRENGLRFAADVVIGQKTGAFLDQRDNRARVRAISRGRRVLDVFSSTGGFSVHAAAGGASTVHSVDLNQASIDASRANMALNDTLRAVSQCRHLVTTGDAFDVMATMAADRRTFDVVVVDPPSFASRQSQAPRALDAYARLAELAASLVERGGTLVQSSCSSRVSGEDFVATMRSGVHRAGRSIESFTRHDHGVDHPIGFPEGGYLKAMFATLN